MEKSGVIKKDAFGEFLTWESTRKMKFKYEKKAGYRTINSMIPVILKHIWEKVEEICLHAISICMFNK